ncbi:sugar ABC transporter permease [Streptomyces sp. NPDC056361]|uniref:sugar ABC transporter permease n=1 Tax=Streptomyces sp. NPDC056361 TaxID=3345795 RepID=UPI0035D8DE26
MTGERSWAEDALGLLLRRVEETYGQVGDRFPLYADPDSGVWTSTGRGSWTGGFWAGLLWLRARHTGGEPDRSAAAAATARLAPWVDADTATRGLILWYGTALAADDDVVAAALRERAAKAVLAGWDPVLGVVPWGAALGGPRLRARADGVPGLVPLLTAAGPQGRAAAAAHLHRHLDLCLDGDGGGRPHPAWRWAEPRRGRAPDADSVPEADPVSGWVPEADPAPGWARGESWLLLAVADGLLHVGGRRPGDVLPNGRLEGDPQDAPQGAPHGGAPLSADPPSAGPPSTGPRSAAPSSAAPPSAAPPQAAPLHAAHEAPWLTGRLAESAERLLLQGEFLDGPLVPPAEAGEPEGPVDTSAAAVAAVALLKLARVPGAGWAEACADRAEAVLRRLVEVHLTRPGGGGRPAGMLLDGCYDKGTGTAIGHELVWGDFFLALGLSGLLGRVDLTRT